MNELAYSFADPPELACNDCGQRLGLSPPIAGRPASLVRCGQCERRFYALDTGPPVDGVVSGEAAHQGFLPPSHMTVRRSNCLTRLIDSLPTGDWTPDERRIDSRREIELPLVAIPLDTDFRPTEVAVSATSLDISSGGMAFISPSNRDANYWVIDFTTAGHTGAQLVLKVIRMEPRSHGFWKVAGMLVTPLDLLSRSAEVLYLKRW